MKALAQTLTSVPRSDDDEATMVDIVSRWLTAKSVPPTYVPTMP